MASRIIDQLLARRILAGSTVGGGVGLLAIFLGLREDPTLKTDADIQFSKSFGYIMDGKEIVKPPNNWSGPLFQIRNDYPRPLKDVVNAASIKGGLPPLPGPDRPLPGIDPRKDSPWLDVDYSRNPGLYCEVIKQYCYEGNVNNGFDPYKNTIRPWYHAPWMHWNMNGREPLNGLTFERPTPPGELAKTQTEPLQTWAVGLYNWAGATVFGKIWSNPSLPDWRDVKFPLGTCVFKVLLTDATDAEVPSMKGAPSRKAVITTRGADDARNRNDFASELRLLQVDFAVRDDRAPTGWVFGTFMYDGSQKDENPWDRIIPVGLMWGNDPQLTPEKVRQGETPKEFWINPVADKLRKDLGGSRPSWGWNGRMNGPADNFISACASCHSTSQRDTVVTMTFPEDSTDKQKMNWFRNISAGQPFTRGDTSGDYSLQLMIGFNNYLAWRITKIGAYEWVKLKIPGTEANKKAAVIEAKRRPLRVGEGPFDADDRPK